MHNNIITDLNEKQEEAVLETEMPILIIAGAGSGKTKVITHKIAHLLINKGYAPEEILAITFTNKAANEMKQRTNQLIASHGINTNLLWVSTFHSACVRILRREIHHLGFGSNFSIYDAQDAKRLLKQVVDEKKLNLPSDSIIPVMSYISLCKNQFLMPKAVAEQAKNENNAFKEKAAIIYASYENFLLKNNALDFDNLILKTIELFEKNPIVLKRYQNQFNYILVDEFQDTNTPQYHLIHLLAQGVKKISVVGDDDQSIYSWRGADISNIAKFKRDFKLHRVIKLEQNYRSTNAILKASHGLISKSRSRMHKQLWSNNAEGQALVFYHSHTDRSESDWVANQIIKLYDAQVPLNKIAIFYRMHHQSRVIEETLRKYELPYQILGGIQFYLRQEIKDILAYMILLINENDKVAMQRAISTPRRGIGAKTLQTIHLLSTQFNLNFVQSVKLAVEDGLIRSRAKKQMSLFLDWLSEMQKIQHEVKLSTLVEKIIHDIQYYAFLKEHEPHYEDKIANIRELIDSIVEFEQTHPEPSLENYLTQVSLSTNIDLLSQKASTTNNPEPCIQMMSLHHSKGLEFDHVFITGLSERLLPHEKALQNSLELEEERRLLYVGITRARYQCYLSAARRVFHFGTMVTYDTSRFLQDIPVHLLCKEKEPVLDQEETMYSSFKSIDNTSNPLLEKNIQQIESQLSHEKNGHYIQQIDQIQIGEYLNHPRYGQCQIVEIKNSNYILPSVTVKLSDNRKLTLILKYAKLSKLDPN